MIQVVITEVAASPLRTVSRPDAVVSRPLTMGGMV
jgi:hypothetical protein